MMDSWQVKETLHLTSDGKYAPCWPLVVNIEIFDKGLISPDGKYLKGLQQKNHFLYKHLPNL